MLRTYKAYNSIVDFQNMNFITSYWVMERCLELLGIECVVMKKLNLFINLIVYL